MAITVEYACTVVCSSACSRRALARHSLLSGQCSRQLVLLAVLVKLLWPPSFSHFPLAPCVHHSRPLTFSRFLSPTNPPPTCLDSPGLCRTNGIGGLFFDRWGSRLAVIVGMTMLCWGCIGKGSFALNKGCSFTLYSSTHDKM